MTPDLYKSKAAAAARPGPSKPPAKSFIVDSELVAVDRSANHRLRAFQELSTRAREGVNEEDISIHVCVFLFDLLYLDGQDLIRLPFRQRRDKLAAAFPGRKPGHVALAEGMELRVVPENAHDAVQSSGAQAAVPPARVAEVCPSGGTQAAHTPSPAAEPKDTAGPIDNSVNAEGNSDELSDLAVANGSIPAAAPGAGDTSCHIVPVRASLCFVSELALPSRYLQLCCACWHIASLYTDMPLTTASQPVHSLLTQQCDVCRPAALQNCWSSSCCVQWLRAPKA